MVKLKTLLLITLVLAMTQASDKGRYFSKKRYTPIPLPHYSEVQKDIPVPILESNPELIDMYWKCWEIGFTHLRQPKEGSPFVSNYWDEAFSPCIFQWDMIFMTHFTKYIHHIFPSVQSLDNFYCSQRPSGYICREIKEATGEEFHYKGIANTINPPLFAWSELEWFKMTNDSARLTAVLPVLDKYMEYLEKERKSHNSTHKLFWQTSLGSGMDNSPRYGSGWVDISSQIVISYKAMAQIAEILHYPSKASLYRSQAKNISKRINNYMWNKKSALYHDIDDKGQQTPYRTIAGFWPLLAGIPSASQAKKLVKSLTDTATFNRTFPFASLSAEHSEYEPEGGYWRGGSWPPVSYMAIKGMNNYGYDNVSYEQTVKLLQAMYAVYKETGTIWEFYAPDTLSYGKLLHKRKVANKTKEAKADFVGWSALGPVALLIEEVIGINCNAPENSITWKINRTEKHGVSNLHLGTNQVSLLYSEKNASPLITGSCTNAFTLAVIKEGKEKRLSVPKGEIHITL